MSKPDEEEVEKTVRDTKEAMERLVAGKLNAAQPTTLAPQPGGPTYIKYTPAQQGPQYNSGASQRIIKMQDLPARCLIFDDVLAWRVFISPHRRFRKSSYLMHSTPRRPVDCKESGSQQTLGRRWTRWSRRSSGTKRCRGAQGRRRCR